MTNSYLNRLPICLLLIAGIGATGNTQAETLSFKATTDFGTIDQGEVPFHSELPYRDSLAIDASIVEYRNLYATASMIYEGSSGFFDVTIIGLAETDGEAPYRLLVNDVLIGTATNPETDIDFTPVRHDFTRVVIPNGAKVSVESLANTNGKIPEGDGTAFARGRWTALELNNDDYESAPGPETEVELSLTVSTDKSVLLVGQQVTLDISVRNADGSAVATGAVLTITGPSSELAIVDQAGCSASANSLTCPLSEIAAGATESLQVTLEALQNSPSAMLRVSVDSDQQDQLPDNNALTLPVSIGKGSVAAPLSATPENEVMAGSGSGLTSLPAIAILLLIKLQRSRRTAKRFRYARPVPF